MPATDPRLLRLATLAAMKRDLHLSQLASAQAALDASLRQREGLEPPPCTDPDPTLQIADLQHQIWAEGRRRILAGQIAARQAERDERRRIAALATGRCNVIERMFGK